eukprot:gene14798-biopygen17129
MSEADRGNTLPRKGDREVASSARDRTQRGTLRGEGSAGDVAKGPPLTQFFRGTSPHGPFPTPVPITLVLEAWALGRNLQTRTWRRDRGGQARGANMFLEETSSEVFVPAGSQATGGSGVGCAKQGVLVDLPVVFFGIPASRQSTECALEFSQICPKKSQATGGFRDVTQRAQQSSGAEDAKFTKLVVLEWHKWGFHIPMSCHPPPPPGISGRPVQTSQCQSRPHGHRQLSSARGVLRQATGGPAASGCRQLVGPPLVDAGNWGSRRSRLHAAGGPTAAGGRQLEVPPHWFQAPSKDAGSWRSLRSRMQAAGGPSARGCRQLEVPTLQDAGSSVTATVTHDSEITCIEKLQKQEQNRCLCPLQPLRGWGQTQASTTPT